MVYMYIHLYMLCTYTLVSEGTYMHTCFHVDMLAPTFVGMHTHMLLHTYMYESSFMYKCLFVTLKFVPAAATGGVHVSEMLAREQSDFCAG
jgi:hypothetical protein